MITLVLLKIHERCDSFFLTVSFAAVNRVVTQHFSRETLRDDPTDGCEGD